MKKQLKLSVKNPCSKKFEHFRPTQDGGFCSSCAKEVIDFTAMTDQEIVHYFDKNHENTCGKFHKSQLQFHPAGHTSRNLRYASLGVVGISLISLLATASVGAQEKQSPKIEVWKSQEKDTTKTSDRTTSKNVIVKGIVKDKNGSLPGVSILLKGTTVGTETDFDGKFKFPTPLKKGDVLIFSYLGYTSKELVVKNNTPSLNLNLEVNLKEDFSCIVLGEVQVEQLFKSKKSLFKKKKKKG